ncbi:hypothetical protein Tco_0070599 [Tanacetum coccineum]
MSRDSHVAHSVLDNSKKAIKNVAVYVRKKKQTDNTSTNVISNKENVIDVDVANASKAKTLLCVSCIQNVLIPCHDKCVAKHKLNVRSNIHRTFSTVKLADYQGLEDKILVPKPLRNCARPSRYFESSDDSNTNVVMLPQENIVAISDTVANLQSTMHLTLSHQSMSEGVPKMCDVPLCENTTPLNALNEHSEIVVNSNDDNSSSDDDSTYGSFNASVFPPVDRSDPYHEEFADELAHIMSLPNLECFKFKVDPDPGDLTSIDPEIRLPDCEDSRASPFCPLLSQRVSHNQLHFGSRTDIQKESQKRPNQARDGKDKVKSKPKSVKVKKSTPKKS